MESTILKTTYDRTMVPGLVMVVFAVCGAVFLSCKEELDLPPIVAEGTRVKIGTDMDIEICAGTLAKLDAHVPIVEQTLEIPRREGKIPIYVFNDDSADIEDLCDGFDACYKPSSSGGPASIIPASDFSVVFHEIVHDIAFNSEFGSPPHFLTEGLALTLGGAGQDDRPAHNCIPTGNYSLDQLLELFDGDDFNYFSAAQVAFFFRYLIATYGPEPLVDWASQLDYRDGPEKIKSAFESQFNIEMDSAWQAHDTDYSFPPPYRCLAKEIPWKGTVWEHTFSTECSDDSVQTIFGDVNRVLTEVVIDFPEKRDYFVEYDRPDDVGFAKCTGCSSSMFVDDLAGPESSPFGFIWEPVGKYVLRRVAEKNAAPLNVKIRAWPEPPFCNAWTQDCPTGQKCQLIEIWPYYRVDCAALAGSPLAEGEPCDLPSYPNGDDCAIGSECFELSGTCTSLCKGTEDNPICDTDQVCIHPGEGHPGYCTRACNPLDDTCPAGQSCGFLGDGFFCMAFESGDGQYGDGCFVIVECGKGLYCADDAVPGCGDACCTAFCDLSVKEPDESCPDFAKGQICKPLNDDIGYCTVVNQSP